MSTLPNGEDPDEMPQNAKHINPHKHIHIKSLVHVYFSMQGFSSIVLHCVFPLMEASFQCYQIDIKKVNFHLKNPQEVFLKL